MACDTVKNYCFICSSTISTESVNKVDRLNALFLLRTLLEIPEDSKLINKESLNLLLTCEHCGSSIKQCKQIYGEICEQIEKFWECQNKILDKFTSKPQSVQKDDQLGETSENKNNYYDNWVNQCCKYVKEHDFTGFGYPFIVHDLETLLISSQLPPTSSSPSPHQSSDNDDLRSTIKNEPFAATLEKDDPPVHIDYDYFEEDDSRSLPMSVSEEDPLEAVPSSLPPTTQVPSNSQDKIIVKEEEEDDDDYDVDDDDDGDSNDDSESDYEPPSSKKAKISPKSSKSTRSSTRNRNVPKCSKDPPSEISKPGDNQQEMYSCDWPGCKKEGKRIKLKRSWESHMNKHRGTPQKKCVYCDLLFYSSNDRQKHVNEIHGDEKKIKGRKVIRKEIDFQYNLKQDPLTGKYYCDWPDCGQQFVCQKALKFHIDKHNGTPRQECDKCNLKFYSRCQLVRHKDMKHGEKDKFSCSICGMRFDLKDQLYHHKTRMHSTKAVIWKICEICGKKMHTTALPRHMKKIHEGLNLKKFACHLCPEAYEKGWDLKIHLYRKHEGWGEEKEREEVRKHLERIRDREKGYLYQCHVKKCKVKFLSEERLREHVEERHGGNWDKVEDEEGMRFRCEICGAGYHDGKRYNEHMTWHRNREILKCGVCGWGCSSKNNLKKHEATHEERERKWWCEVCRRGFVEEKGLRQHLEGKLHKWRVEKEGELRKECDVCKQRFRNGRSLGLHKRKVHLKKGSKIK